MTTHATTWAIAVLKDIQPADDIHACGAPISDCNVEDCFDVLEAEQILQQVIDQALENKKAPSLL